MGTPRAFGSAHPQRRPEKERDLLFSWHRKPHSAGSSFVDSELLDLDFDQASFPLFGQSPPDHNMAGRSSPINIATSTRNGSISPRTNQTSNLTSALSATSGNELRPASAMDIGSGNGKGMSYGKHDSSGFGSNYGSGAQAIPMNGANKERPRRESMASSMVQGMSWGGVSVSSWIRDE